MERWNNILGESILGTLRAAWHQARSGCFAALGVVGVTTPHRFKGTSAAFARGSGAPRASRPPPAPHNAGSRAGGSLWDPLTKGHPRNTAQRQSPPPVPELCGGLTAAGAPSLPQHAGELTRSRRRSHVGPRGRSPFSRGCGRPAGRCFSPAPTRRPALGRPGCRPGWEWGGRLREGAELLGAGEDEEGKERSLVGAAVASARVAGRRGCCVPGRVLPPPGRCASPVQLRAACRGTRAWAAPRGARRS